jgi:hypothetical protein
MLTSRWIRSGLWRKLSQWIPSLGRAFNFPVKTSFAGDFATAVLEDEEQEMAFEADGLEEALSILQPAMANDAGDTSAYPSGRTTLRSTLFRMDHCVVTGHTMMVLDRSGASVMKPWRGDSNWNEAKPTLLRRLQAPSGTFYTLTCNGHFFHFFANDIIPLLYFLRRYGDEIGQLHIVTKAGFPPFIQQTLSAICSAYKNVTIFEIDKTERLIDVSALWLSREPCAREWMPVTRSEADELGRLLSEHHKLPVATAPEQLLFVSRGATPLRRLVNEAELMADLLDFDFEFFLPKSDDHASQIEAFRSARIVVAVHGAALTNLLFCQPGALVIELFPSNHIKSTYCWLAMRLGLRYRAVIGFSGDHLQAFSIKIPLVIAEVEAELKINDVATGP